MYLIVMAKVEEWKQTLRAFLKILCGSHLLISYWPKKLAWPNSESRGKEIDPTHLVRETIKLHGKEAWIQGEKRNWNSICYITATNSLTYTTG